MKQFPTSGGSSGGTGGTGSGSSVRYFTDLTDVPHDYTGHGSAFIVVTTDATGLTFGDFTSLGLRYDVFMQDASVGQRDFYPDFTFNAGFNELLAFKNGAYLRSGYDYTELDNTTVRLDVTCAGTEKITIAKTLADVLYIDKTISEVIDRTTNFHDVYGDLTSMDITGNYVCSRSSLRLFVSTADTTLTVTLPPSPQPNDIIEIINADNSFEIHNLFIDGNGKLVMGSADFFVIDVNTSVTFIFHSTKGWRSI